MAHTYTRLLVHCVFSTKEHRALIPQEMQPGLWAYIGGIARKNGFLALAVGGTENHAHVLLGIPAGLPVAKAVPLIKAGSSKWLREQRGLELFGWQEAYGAFTIGASQIAKTVSYIQNQPAHHRKRPFEEEYRALLRAYDIAHEEQYLFG
jgi:REP element-mobilizing transposase RayT